jgi:hypothetical protein
MRRVSNSGERRYEVLFAVGNGVPAVVLGVGVFALPVRWWPADVVIGAVVVAVLASTAAALSRPALARQALRVGASVLLGAGLLVIAVATLSLAFLAGIHGDFGRGGVTLMMLVLFLVLPYTLVYPAIELLWLGAPSSRTPAPSSAAKASKTEAEGGASA